MQLKSNSFDNGKIIPGHYAFCIADPVHHVSLSRNTNPHFTWSEAPQATRSLALICHDPDVPSRGDDVNQESRTVPASLPRIDFFHWVLIDLPASLKEIIECEFSDKVTPRGKPGPGTLYGARQGINDYTGWFASDDDMRGNYFGYDGPCPPWNDEIGHRYIFTLYALDIERLPLDGIFSGQQALAAMQGHVLAESSLTGLYSLNPAVAL